MHKQASAQGLPGPHTRTEQDKVQDANPRPRARPRAGRVRQRATSREQAGRQAVQQGPQRSTGSSANREASRQPRPRAQAQVVPPTQPPTRPHRRQGSGRKRNGHKEKPRGPARNRGARGPEEHTESSETGAATPSNPQHPTRTPDPTQGSGPEGRPSGCAGHAPPATPPQGKPRVQADPASTPSAAPRGKGQAPQQHSKCAPEPAMRSPTAAAAPTQNKAPGGRVRAPATGARSALTAGAAAGRAGQQGIRPTEGVPNTTPTPPATHP